MTPVKVYAVIDGRIYRHGELVGFYNSLGETENLSASLSVAQQMQIKFLVKEKLGLAVRKRRGRRRTTAPVLDLTLPPVETNGIPPAPALDPRYGDKTPAFVEWMFKYCPEEAKKKYAFRRVQGVQMPGAGDTFPEISRVQAAPIGDLPPGAMEEEKAEQWLK